MMSARVVPGHSLGGDDSSRWKTHVRRVCLAGLFACLAAWMGCDSAEDPLEDGAFRAETGGAVRERLEGHASYTEIEATAENAILVLTLVAGGSMSVGDPEPAGVFISTFWNRMPGPYTIQGQTGRVRDYVVLESGRTFLVEGGTVEIREVSDRRVQGTFTLNAAGSVISGGGVIQAAGEFIALAEADAE